ncbi:TRAP transporter small permease [Halomonas sp. EGI 63088]|uniref:TRAP transporter small permease protein n=1 Tax=Halomonas flagellata TaxID=2920385 RepID=A0ABS9S048_9GAMM|nr:TRAP transporter small permease [Halomonas flagellata]MCH4565483.1 TRAP transporter small permease [Halomonas flagellata]
MKKLVAVLDSTLSIFCVLLTVVLVACVIWQVFSRYVLGVPSTLTDELARFLFIWVGLMGAAYTLGQNKHLAMDFLLMKLDGRANSLLKLVISLACVVFAGVVMLYGGGGLMLKTLSMGQISPALGIQMGMVYLAIPLSGFIMLVYLFRDILSALNGFFGD